MCCALGYSTVFTVYSTITLQAPITGVLLFIIDQQLEIILRWQHLISCSSVEVKVKVVVKFGVSSLQCKRTDAEPLDLTSEKKINKVSAQTIYLFISILIYFKQRMASLGSTLSRVKIVICTTPFPPQTTKILLLPGIFAFTLDAHYNIM